MGRWSQNRRCLGWGRVRERDWIEQEEARIPDWGTGEESVEVDAVVRDWGILGRAADAAASRRRLGIRVEKRNDKHVEREERGERHSKGVAMKW